MCVGFVLHSPAHSIHRVIAFNRDEFYERPSLPLHLWPQGFYAGKDLRAGGTWLAIGSDERFAMLTNIRSIDSSDSKVSRGELCLNYLTRDQNPHEYLSSINTTKFNPFHLVVSNSQECLLLSSATKSIRKLTGQDYGLSNSQLGTDWWKATNVLDQLQSELSAVNDSDIAIETCFELLSSKQPAPEAELPAERFYGLEVERSLSAPFVNLESYGTVSSSVFLTLNSGSSILVERRYSRFKDYEETRIEFPNNRPV